jgi:prevent-host-death family protein
VTLLCRCKKSKIALKNLSKEKPKYRRTINYINARNQFAGLTALAVRDREPITITRNGTGKVVLSAIEEDEAMEVMLHLFATKSNALQIQQSLDDDAAGKRQGSDLCG